MAASPPAPTSRAQTQLDLVLAAVADGVYAITPDGSFAHVNPAAAAIYGYDSAEKMLATSFDEHLDYYSYFDEHDQPVKRADLPAARVFAGARDRQEALLQLRRSGEPTKWLRMKTSPVHDNAGELLMALAIVEDVTDSRRTHDELRHSRDRFRAVLAGVPDAVTVQGPDGALLYANDAAANLLGHARGEDVIAAGVAGVLAPLDFFDESGELVPAEARPAGRALAGEVSPPAQTLKMVRRDTGEKLWLRLRSAAVLDDNGEAVRLVCNVFEDVTAQRRLARELKRSHDQLDTILQGVTDSITASSPDGELLYANQAALDALGYATADELRAADPEELLMALNLRDEDGLPVDPTELPAQQVGPARPVAETVVRYHHAQKGDRWALMKASALFDEEGDLSMTLSISEDITSQKAEQEQLRNVAETLQASILPAELPDIPGLDLAVAFTPRGGDYHQVGGDFYDVFPVDDGWLLLAGDVCGKGPEAAAATSLCRYAVRALAMHETSPAKLLDDLNEAIIRHRDDGRFATVALAHLHMNDDGSARVRLALGGHPFPYVLVGDGTVKPVGEPGALVGVFREQDIATEVEFILAPEETLIFYTDGVTEARNPDGQLFELDSYLEGWPPASAADLCAAIEQQALTFQGGAIHDDIALLLARLPAAPLVNRRYPARAESAAEMRRDLAALEDQFPGVDWQAIALMCTELATNAIRYGAAASCEDWVELRVNEREPGTLRVAVASPGEPFNPKVGAAELTDESGRGLFLVDAMSERWGSATDESCVWFECIAKDPAS